MTESPTTSDPGKPESRGFLHSVWQVAKTVQARLRFIAILALIGAGFMFKDTITARYEKWIRPRLTESAATNPDLEFWCPMHPTIVRDHSDKCPICGMPLSRRKKSEAPEPDEALPPGIVSRIQLTPYRVAAAGIQTVPVAYQPLSKEIRTVGFVEFDERKLARISVRPNGKSRIDKLFVNVTGEVVEKGQVLAEVYSPDLVATVQNLLDARKSNNVDLERITREKLVLWGIDNEQIDAVVKTGKPITNLTIRSPISGHVIRKYQVEGDYVEEGARLFDVADLATVWIEAQVYEDDISFMKTGLPITATTKAFPSREFTGRLAFIHPHLDASTRTLKVRFDMDNARHDLRPGMYATVVLQVPAARLITLLADAGDKQKKSHEQGLVLAVPEAAVIDTGSRKIVYREAGLDLFEGIEVQLGSRCGVFYPVIRGLNEGDRVATAGSFLIDAETRLTAGASSTYFGASGAAAGGGRNPAAGVVRPSMTRDEEDQVEMSLAKLNVDDQRLARAQRLCAVLTDNRLGSMGVPFKVMVDGQPVFLCCNACSNDALASAKRTLERVAQAKAAPASTRLDAVPKAAPPR